MIGAETEKWVKKGGGPKVRQPKKFRVSATRQPAATPQTKNFKLSVTTNDAAKSNFIEFTLIFSRGGNPRRPL